ncbi:MAG: hypothetical protein ACRCZZ_01480 [Phocaeicola sp.]
MNKENFFEFDDKSKIVLTEEQVRALWGFGRCCLRSCAEQVGLLTFRQRAELCELERILRKVKRLSDLKRRLIEWEKKEAERREMYETFTPSKRLQRIENDFLHAEVLRKRYEQVLERSRLETLELEVIRELLKKSYILGIWFNGYFTD